MSNYQQIVLDIAVGALVTVVLMLVIFLGFLIRKFIKDYSND